MDVDNHLTFVLTALGLILASAFFAAAEVAILTLRRRRVEQVDPEVPTRAAPAFSAAEEAEEISLVTQLGGIVTTLLLGYYSAVWGIATFARVPAIAGMWVGLLLAAGIQIVFGQQIPRFLGANHPTWVTHSLVLRPLRFVSLILRPALIPLSFLLNALSDGLRLSRTAFYAPVHTPEDIRELVRHGHEQGVVEEDESEMIHGVFDFSETVAREVMTPRIDIIAVPVETTLDELVALLVDEGHSRIPVFEGSIDNIVGVLLAKDLLPVLAASANGATPFDLRTIMREPYFVPDTKPVDDILDEFRQSSVHLAIVIDEFGGTYGLVTMEDLLEEIVGEIQDEYDIEEPEFAPTPEGDFLIDGGAAISDVNERFGLEIPEADFDTIGGYIFGTLGRVPVAGDTIEGVGGRGDQQLEVEGVEDRRVTRVRLRRSGAAVVPES